MEIWKSVELGVMYGSVGDKTKTLQSRNLKKEKLVASSLSSRVGRDNANHARAEWAPQLVCLCNWTEKRLLMDDRSLHLVTESKVLRV